MAIEGTESGLATGNEGQAEGALETASAAAPEVNGTEQPSAATSPGQQEEETFFNPEDIKDKPELMAAYKQMQAAFTKKTQGIKSKAQAAEAYEQFMANPHANIAELAQKLGYQLTPAQQAAMDNQEKGDPQTWDEVYQTAEERAYNRIKKDLEPLINSFKDMKRTSIEKMLDDSAPDWRQYEDEMQANLQKHPTLVNDPLMLYSLSIPANVRESRATQAALKKLKEKMDSAEPSGISTTKQSKVPAPEKGMSFRESVAYAQQKLAEKGIKAPPGFNF